MVIYHLIALLLVTFFLPSWMRKTYRNSSAVDADKQFIILLVFQFCLALSVFLSFFISWFSYWVVSEEVVPWATGLDITDPDYWDAPLTPRSFMAIVLVLATPIIVFLRIGLLAVRDTHQVCKEQVDRLKKTHKIVGPAFKGV
jgi:lysylphosphatidylglycerol synthetase-like protein (DUF2156 family)